MVKYSIVIPCYRSSETIGKVVELMMEELRDEIIEFVLVNDASPDEGKTLAVINRLSEQYGNVISIDLARNSGQHNAIMCALNYACGEYIIAMDDDMQTHPSQVKKLIAGIEQGYDMVYAYYPEKKHSGFRRLGSLFNEICEYLFIGKPRTLKTSSYWIIKKFVRDEIIRYKNAFTYLDGLFMRTTDNIGNVPVEHFEREVGQSGYTLKKLIAHWFDIIGFTIAPLKAAMKLGAVIVMGSFLGAICIALRKILFGISVNGYASIMVLMCFFFGIILGFMGLIGEYLGRIFLSVNTNPQYIVRSVKGKNE